MAKIPFTAPRVAAFRCAPDKAQAFLWDTVATGLGLRSTPAGKPAYVFQGEYQGKTIRITIGNPDAWQLEDRDAADPDGTGTVIKGARSKARELRRQIDEGSDPRDLKRDARAVSETKKAEADAKAVSDKLAVLTVKDVWDVYLAARRPRWGDLHYNDHVKLARAGGVEAKRGTDGRGVTIDMPLFPLMGLPLRALDAATVEAWAARQALTRPASARLSWRLLKGFLSWCAEQPEYVSLLPTMNPAKTKKAREALGKAGVKSDVLQRGQLRAWFEAVHKTPNPIIAAALQVILLTGARPGEVLSMRWEDVNTKWKGLTIRDKVEGERVIPLTPYVAHLLAPLRRRNALIFSSATAKAGALTAPRKHHVSACTVAGIDALSLHGLRRSFKSLTEWLDIPAGVVAQLMGHKPSGTAEKHYTVRPLDLLRVHHERIEAWILEHAGIEFVPVANEGKLRAIV